MTETIETLQQGMEAAVPAPDFYAACRATLALLAARSAGASVCPSEVARAIAAASKAGGPPDWRERMPIVHAAIDRLLAEGLVRLHWKGSVLDARSGPYRISRSDPQQDSATS